MHCTFSGQGPLDQVFAHSQTGKDISAQKQVYYIRSKRVTTAKTRLRDKS